MLHDSISFAIDTKEGTPYVSTCRGTVSFETVEDASAFVAARVLSRLRAYKEIWDTFDAAVEAHAGSLTGRRDSDELPF